MRTYSSRRLRLGSHPDPATAFMIRVMTSALVWPVLLPVHVYRAVLSPLKRGPSCRFLSHRAGWLRSHRSRACTASRSSRRGRGETACSHQPRWTPDSSPPPRNSDPDLRGTCALDGARSRAACPRGCGPPNARVVQTVWPVDADGAEDNHASAAPNMHFRVCCPPRLEQPHSLPGRQVRLFTAPTGPTAVSVFGILIQEEERRSIANRSAHVSCLVSLRHR
jgi:hypothetical protein